MTFQLDHRLIDATLPVGETDELVCLLINDQRFPWVLLVPRVEGVAEIFQLSSVQQNHLMQTSAVLGQELMSLFDGHKLNVASLGNIVGQLHLHHVVRKKGDDAWPGPVWGFGKPVSYSRRQGIEVVSTLQETLSLLAD